MSNNTVENTITLRSSDGEEFIMTETEAKISNTICRMIEDDCAQSTIPLPNVTSKILTKLMEYCKKHVSDKEGGDHPTASSEAPTTNKDMENWDREFLTVDQGTLFDLLLAANYLEIHGLLNLVCENVADQMKGKKADEIRAHFNIVNDYTPEEEEEVRQENIWAFE